MKKNWKWFGDAGHFCLASKCRFHLCTEVGKFLVSTVGDLHKNPEDENPEPLGIYDGFYETAVFPTLETRCSCGCGMPDIDLQQIEMVRFNTRKEANEGHLQMCLKYDS